MCLGCKFSRNVSPTVHDARIHPAASLAALFSLLARPQCYVMTASPARNPDSKYQAWGHSSVVDPWGTVVATTEHDSAMVLAEVDLNRVREVRKGIPVSLQKRPDLYRLELS